MNLLDSLTHDACKDAKSAEEDLRESGLDPDEISKWGLQFIEKLKESMVPGKYKGGEVEAFEVTDEFIRLVDSGNKPNFSDDPKYSPPSPMFEKLNIEYYDHLGLRFFDTVQFKWTTVHVGDWLVRNANGEMFRMERKMFGVVFIDGPYRDFFKNRESLEFRK